MADIYVEAGDLERLRSGVDAVADGLAQVRVNIDEAGKGDEPIGVDPAGILRPIAGLISDCGDHAVLDEDVVTPLAEDVSGGDEPGASRISHESVLRVRAGGRGRPYER